MNTLLVPRSTSTCSVACSLSTRDHRMSRMKNVLPSDTTVTVSSTMDPASKKKNLLDGSSETCWTSDQGLPQHCHLSFPTPIQGATHMALVFQGGFAGTAMSVYVATEGEELKLGGRLFPEDRNRRQVFEIPYPSSKGPLTELKLEFEKSSDPWGRVTIYEFEILA